MEQYINKAAVVADIERRKHKLLDNIICERDKEWVVRTAHQLNRIILSLDTFEVKEVKEEPESEDLEEAAYQYGDCFGKRFDIASMAFIKGAKWQKEHLIDKVCEWLEEHKEHPFIGCEDPCLSGYLTDEFIENFKKTMEDKL